MESWAQRTMQSAARAAAVAPLSSPFTRANRPLSSPKACFWASAAAEAQKQAFGELRGLLARVNGDDSGATAAARAADCIVRWAQDSMG